jgi:hypothetical protein
LVPLLIKGRAAGRKFISPGRRKSDDALIPCKFGQADVNQGKLKEEIIGNTVELVKGFNRNGTKKAPVLPGACEGF